MLGYVLISVGVKIDGLEGIALPIISIHQIFLTAWMLDYPHFDKTLVMLLSGNIL